RVYIQPSGMLQVGYGITVGGTAQFNGAVQMASTCVLTANFLQSNVDLGVRVTAPAGSHGCFYSTVTNARSWRIGCFSDGTFHIYDASGPRDCMNVGTDGQISIANNLNMTGGRLNTSDWVAANPVFINSSAAQNAIYYGTVAGVRQYYFGVMTTGVF